MYIREWDARFGGVGNARCASITGRLAEVCDGTHTYIMHTNERCAKRMIQRFMSTADYTGEVRLTGRIISANDEESSYATFKTATPLKYRN